MSESVRSKDLEAGLQGDVKQPTVTCTTCSGLLLGLIRLTGAIDVWSLEVKDVKLSTRAAECSRGSTPKSQSKQFNRLQGLHRCGTINSGMCFTAVA